MSCNIYWVSRQTSEQVFFYQLLSAMYIGIHKPIHNKLLILVIQSVNMTSYDRHVNKLLMEV